MASPEPVAGLPDDERAEARLGELLDAYASALQRGEAVDRAAWLAQHPELGQALECLEILENFARQIADQENLPEPAPSDSALTCVYTGGDSDGDLGFAPLAFPRGFGDYELLSEIGRGGMGVVYKARQSSLARTVALKMVLSSQLASEQQVRRFRAEAKAAAGLRHPHIVSVFETGQVQGQHYFAMDFIEGQSLAERLRQGPLDLDAAVRLLIDVARAVDYLHQHGIVHRDLKPANILLDAEGRPYVTDFGLAKVFDSDEHLTQTGTIAGTPSYMAPEQAAGASGNISPRSDVYSLGAVLYELLTGRPPFQAPSALDTLVQVLEREPPNPRKLNRHVPRALELICLTCLEKSPDNRYDSAASLVDDLERFLRGETVEARRPGMWRGLLRWGRREPALVWRWAAYGLFYVVELLNYFGWQEVSRENHLRYTGVFVVSLFASLGFQQALKRYSSQAAPMAWALFDVVSLGIVVWLGGGADSPMVVAYPALVVVSGLWFRVRLVGVMTVLSLLSYAAFAWLGPQRASEPGAVVEHVPVAFRCYFAVALLIVGAAVAYQVHRVRALSRYYESRRA